ncbi:MAG: zinc-binding dehydrogenase, partial [Candidatus Hydrogenedentes bacterium]|nr:zinc-binding dehydrogenase [Candidatus Hydrogenedentota bacterium]
VAVFGLGVVGMLTVQMAKQSGAIQVLAIDVLDYRVQAAPKYGADAAFLAPAGSAAEKGAPSITWIMEQTNGRGVDVAIDCTNSSDGLGLACAATRLSGNVVLTGISGKEEDSIPVSITRRRELTLRWCRRFLHNYPTTIAMIDAGRLDAASLITHVFPFEQADKAFALTAAYTDGVFKASVEW